MWLSDGQKGIQKGVIIAHKALYIHAGLDV